MKVIKWLKRLGLAVLTLLVLAIFAGFVFERISRSDAERITPNGSFADLGDHRLHYLMKGDTGVTIVFETALDPTGHLQWINVQNEIAQFARTISYDRAGILWSERGSNPKSGDQIASELHELLLQAQAPKPYVLVGHSLGGLFVRYFVDKYPEEVAGVILIDR